MANKFLVQLFHDLAELYAQEGNPQGPITAQYLREAIPNLPKPRAQNNEFSQVLLDKLVPKDHPIMPNILHAIPFIHWGGSDLREGRIPQDLGDQMPMCELLGPDGLVAHESVRVGLWMQTKGVVYGPRRHEAEETFIQLSGSALWSTEASAPQSFPTGAIIHHPSNILHTSQTTDQFVFAAWRWSGNIGFDAYSLKQ